jgi:hypothetical protein
MAVSLGDLFFPSQTSSYPKTLLKQRASKSFSTNPNII